jgi:hypothetical protein
MIKESLKFVLAHPKTTTSLLYLTGTMLTMALAKKRTPAGTKLSVKDKVKIGLVWPISLPLLVSK